MLRHMIHLGDRGARTSIAQRLALLTPTHRPRWGRMSAHQAVCHLGDSFRFALGRKSASDAPGMLNHTLVKWIALYVPVSWPKGVSTRPEMEQGLGGTPPCDFPRDRADLIGLIDEFAVGNEFAPAHPIFGPLTAREWMRWGFLHADHHLRQFGV